MSALLLFGDTERSAALRHELPLPIIDPLMFCELDGRRVVLSTDIERTRIARARPGVEILDYFDFGLKELRESGLSSREAEREAVARAVRHLELREAVVPGEFPVGLADRLRADGLELTIDDEQVLARRRCKQGAELAGIRAAAAAAEAGMAAAAGLLARAVPGAESRLYLDGSELHCEHVRAAMRRACADAGAVCPPEVIVASVWNGFGHEAGHGPLPAGLPIVVDLWPQDETSACWADMTRTFVVGEPSAEAAGLIAEQEELVEGAHRGALAAVRPGITGRELFDAACEGFEAAGYRTQRTGPGEDPAEGFQFSLGHGVGLEVHEAPSLGLGGREPLIAGDVLAIEPGLWDRRIGGVRFEDLVLVTEDGAEQLTHFPYELGPPGDVLRAA